MSEIACSPKHSVVVSACAGSGKTWLLVARLVRLLLADVKPHEILALTFTRKAAQEMRTRLYELLQAWSTMDDAHLLKELSARGMNNTEAQAQLDSARTLFEKLLANPRSVVIDTFHGWFGRLLSAAPISLHIQHGFSLREDAKRLQAECLEEWWGKLPESIQVHYEVILDQLGAYSSNEFLLGSNSLLKQKGAWFFFLEDCKRKGTTPLQVLEKRLSLLSIHNPIAVLLQAPNAIHDLQFMRLAQFSGGPKDQKLLEDLDPALLYLESLDRPVADDDLFVCDRLQDVFLIKSDPPKSRDVNDAVSKTVGQFLNSSENTQAISVEDFIHFKQTWANACLDYVAWKTERKAFELNRAWFAMSDAMMAEIKRVKTLKRVRDFDDLEMGVAEMMADSSVAAYLQARLDARYKHILIDEFQDTNPLQWQILKTWLEAYGEDSSRPTVFIVGDPKQSIYRFRRADPRLFKTAELFLQTHFAAHKETKKDTRRNSAEIIHSLNRIFQSSGVPSDYDYVEQGTLVQVPPLPPPLSLLENSAEWAHGEFYRLPLIERNGSDLAPRQGNALEQPLVDSEQTISIQQRLLEGKAVAELIQYLIQTRWVIDEKQEGGWRKPVPGDFLLLVKRRHYLPQYEQALREAHLQFDSPRLGGLLNTLEVDDLIALLTVLMTPTQNLALAQVLRSPLFSFNETQMQKLAELVQSNLGYRSWWDVLIDPIQTQADEAFLSAARHLIRWAKQAHHLPVHDLLDLIYYEGDMRARYAAAAQELDRHQVLANLNAFLKLALDLDGGRYPSLSRFVRHLNQMKRGDDDETPNEGSADFDDEEFQEDEFDGELNYGAEETAAERAKRVRLLTIHGAKGLEAPFVIVLDANHTKPKPFGRGVLLDWEPDQIHPQHISMFTKTTLTQSCTDLRDRETEIAEKENWNLLYVALTRAKQGVWISGVKNTSSKKDGLDENSWYSSILNGDTPEWDNSLLSFSKTEAMQVVDLNQSKINKANTNMIQVDDFVVNWRPDFEVEESQFFSASERYYLEEGKYLHRILQEYAPCDSSAILTGSEALPSVEGVMNWLGVGSKQAALVLQRAHSILDAPDLSSYFDPQFFLKAWNELDLIADDERSMRIDRLVEFTDRLVILDYKLTIPSQDDPKFASYREQLLRYQLTLAQIRPDKPIEAWLIDAMGQRQQLVP